MINLKTQDAKHQVSRNPRPLANTLLAWLTRFYLYLYCSILDVYNPRGRCTEGQKIIFKTRMMLFKHSADFRRKQVPFMRPLMARFADFEPRSWSPSNRVKVKAVSQSPHCIWWESNQGLSQLRKVLAFASKLSRDKWLFSILRINNNNNSNSNGKATAQVFSWH